MRIIKKTIKIQKKNFKNRQYVFFSIILCIVYIYSLFLHYIIVKYLLQINLT